MTEEERQKTGRRVTDGEPARWLKGCYLGADAVLDRVRVLKSRLATAKGHEAQLGIGWKHAS